MSFSGFTSYRLAGLVIHSWIAFLSTEILRRCHKDDIPNDNTDSVKSNMNQWLTVPSPFVVWIYDHTFTFLLTYQLVTNCMKSTLVVLLKKLSWRGWAGVALGPMQSMGHRSSHSKSWDLLSKVENGSGEVNLGWILSKLGTHMPKTVFYWRHYFWSHLKSVLQELNQF